MLKADLVCKPLIVCLAFECCKAESSKPRIMLHDSTHAPGRVTVWRLLPFTRSRVGVAKSLSGCAKVLGKCAQFLGLFRPTPSTNLDLLAIRPAHTTCNTVCI